MVIYKCKASMRTFVMVEEISACGQRWQRRLQCATRAQIEIYHEQQPILNILYEKRQSERLKRTKKKGMDKGRVRGFVQSLRRFPPIKELL